MKLSRKTTSTNVRRHGRRGFTLVELIVVLIILAILAAIGATSIVGYINRSKFDRNESNAITIYQATQTAITQKIENGSLDGESGWVLTTFGTAAFGNDLNSLVNPNDSVHETVALTYNPNNATDPEAVALYNLTQSYFYDKSIFGGTISIVFDINATKTTLGISYSSSVVGVFYSEQNSAESGWGSFYINPETDNHAEHGGTRTDAPWCDLPCTDIGCRFNDTYVGYFDGTEGSAVVTGGIRSVFFPVVEAAEPIIDPVGPIAGSTVDEDDVATGFLFNLRNGETLDVIWSIFDEYGNPEVQTYTPVTITLYNGYNPTNTVEHGPKLAEIKIDAAVTGATFSNPVTTYEYIKKGDLNLTITKVSQQGFVSIHVTYPAGSNPASADIVVPITRTSVSGDTRLGCPTNGQYVSYTLSLDCLMTRGDYDDTNSASRILSSTRLLNSATPYNICATIRSTSSDKIPETYASRAIDDPIYFTGMINRRMNGTSVIMYGYNTQAGHAAFDDNRENKYNCIVNTLFGDLCYGDDDGHKGGSFSGAPGEDTQGTVNAVITSFRHLSNIRLMNKSGTNYYINYRIAANLNWYTRYSNLVFSEVRMFSYKNRSSYNIYSPVVYGYNEIKIVSFPAIPVLGQGQSLSAITVSRGNIQTTYSINNLQLRKASFNGSTDAAFGLICNNKGLVYNIYTNNFNLVLASVPYGASSDYITGIANNNSAVTADLSGTTLADKPVGGLIGINNGSVGANPNGSSILDSENTIHMSNSVVMSSDYWKIGDKYKQATGGIIGKNSGSVYGVLSLTGHFAIVGRDCVAGIIGWSTSDICARMIVNGDIDVSNEFVFPAETRGSGDPMSCVLISKNQIGGAIGWMQNCTLTCPVGNRYSYTSSDSGISFNELTDSDYQISVTLPSDSLILQLGGWASDYNKDEGKIKGPSAGGAIGLMSSCGKATDYVSIRVRNYGNIIVNDTSNNYWCGGAIGRDYDGKTGSVYIDIVNGSENNTTRIGYTSDNTGPLSTGGAYGYIDHGSGNRTIAINAENYCTITSRGGVNANGAGGAIGGVTDGFTGSFIIRVKNGAGSQIIGNGNPSNADYHYGTGGAIGCAYNSLEANYSSSVICAENHGSINGHTYVGGAVGFSRSNYATVRVVSTNININGDKYVGGAIGCSKGAVTTITVGMNGVDIVGSGDYVSGAIGYSEGAVTTMTVDVNGGKIESPGNYVSGAIGYSGGAVTSITVGINNCKIMGSGSYVAGAVGKSAATIDSVSVNLESSSIQGTDYIAGAIGCNSADVSTISVTANGTKDSIGIKGNQYISAGIGYNDHAVTTITINSEGEKIEGQSNSVGGAVGCNKGNLNSVTVIYNNGSIQGADYVGGAIGYNSSAVIGSMDVTLNGTKDDIGIKGNSNIGGVIGYNECAVTSIVINSSNAKIEAQNNYAGGAIGCNKGNVTTVTVSAFTNGYIHGIDYIGGAVGYISNTVGLETVTVVSANSKITGHDYVGGVIGDNNANITNKVGITFENGYIWGNDKVGGAIGHSASTYTIGSVEAVINGTSAAVIEGNSENICVRGNNYVSAGIGYNQSAITAISVTSTSGKIEGVDNIGSAIGSNAAAVTNMTVTCTGVKVHGQDYIGGAIGFNSGSVTTVTVVKFENGSIDGRNYIGGVIGKNEAGITTISATITGVKDGVGIRGTECVGGAIGHNSASVGTVSVTSNGGMIEGGNYTAGAVGYTNAAITTVAVDINSGSTSFGVKGNRYVGGAVGYSSRNLDSVSVRIYRDNAVQGNRYVGGAIGAAGKSDDSTSFTIGSITVEINSARPVVQVGDSVGSEEACIGGVIGQLYRGTISSIALKGNGGSVNPGEVIPNYTFNTYQNAMLISGSGKAIGGIVGQIGSSSTSTSAKIAAITVGVINSDSSVSSRLGLCVVSTNGSQGIGGWIGACYASVIGDSTALPVFNVDNVLVVYSYGECVGGFCGTLNRAGSGSGINAYIEGTVNINLNGAMVTGRARVGGVLGDMNGAKLDGNFRLTMDNGTRIGDFNGSISETGEVDTTNCICVDVGGAIGRYTNSSIPTNDVGPADAEGHYRTDSYGRVSVEIIDEESKIFAGSLNTEGLAEGLTLETAGVGGAVGRYGKSGGGKNPAYGVKNDTFEAYMYVISSSRYTTVYSAGSNVGGCFGYILSGTIRGCFSTAVVRGDDLSRVNDPYDPEDPDANLRVAAGGFVGRIDAGEIYHCYSGGHTVEGQYISGFENVVGVYNVGGLIGFAGTGVTKINQCYTTVSVCGVGCVGGFLGRITSTTGSLIIDNYCTGLVSGYDPTIPQDIQYFGCFAGYVANLSVFNTPNNPKNANKIVKINDSLLRVGNHLDNDLHRYAVFEATFNKTGDDCIRVNDTSIYHAHPFDDSLMDHRFPLRTFMSYTWTDGKWHGVHYGDWPFIISENKIDIDHVIIAGRHYPYEGLHYAYSNTGEFVPQSDIAVYYGSTPLTVDVHYRISYMGCTGAGVTGTMVIVGISTQEGQGYSGSVSVPFYIDPANLESADADHRIAVTGIDGHPIYEHPYEYTGSPICPTPIVKLDGVALVAGTDYDVVYSNNTDCGTATITIVGKGNYEGSIDRTFEISRTSIVGAVISGISDTYPYTGDEIRPQPMVDVRGRTLIPDTDYTVTYEGTDGLINAGSVVTVKIVGIGNYVGTVEKTFTIVQADLADAQITGIDNEYHYTGQAIEPRPTVSLNGNTLPTDAYTVEYVGSAGSTTDAGNRVTLTVTASEGGNYTGSISVYYDIVTESIVGATVTGIDDEYSYDSGNPITPEPIVTLGSGVTLTNGTDYSVAYESNTDVGTATIIITGINNYSGEIRDTFEIVPVSCTVAFMVDSEVYEQVEVNYRDSVSAPTDPTSTTGRVFDYWYLDDPETAYVFGTPVTSDITLTAKWVDVFTVTFMANGSQYGDVVNVNSGSTVSAPAQDPVSVYGKTFDYWYLDDESVSYDFSTPVTDNIILFAHWVDTMTVTFNSRGGSTVDSQSVGEGHAVNKPDNPSWEDHDFVYWYLDDPETEYDFSSPVMNDIVLYARWNPDPDDEVEP